MEPRSQVPFVCDTFPKKKVRDSGFYLRGLMIRRLWRTRGKIWVGSRVRVCISSRNISIKKITLSLGNCGRIMDWVNGKTWELRNWQALPCCGRSCATALRQEPVAQCLNESLSPHGSDLAARGYCSAWPRYSGTGESLPVLWAQLN